MFHQERFPDKWKRAEVVPMEKVQNPTTLKDFRPVLLLFHCGKIAEKFFIYQYKKPVLPKLNTNLFAYQKNLGTTDALVYALDR